MPDRWEVTILDMETDESYEDRYDAETADAARDMALSSARTKRSGAWLEVVSIRQVHRSPRRS